MRRVLVCSVLPLLSLVACGSPRGDAEASSTGAAGAPSSAVASPASPGANPSEVAFRLPERDLFPEGMAWDPVTGDFFLGSLRKSKIIRISGDGIVDTLAGMAELGQGGILGMKVDADRRILWANFHQSGEQLGADLSSPFRTGIHKIDLSTGRLLRSYSIEKEEENHLFNDIALASDGTVYLTSYSRGTLYRIGALADSLEEWLPMPEGVYTNGIAMGPDGRFLFVVGNDSVYRVEIETRELAPLDVPEGAYVGFGDGIYFHDGGLIIIAAYGEQGRRDYRVSRLALSEDRTAIESLRVLDQDHPLYGYPTTGAPVDGWFYYIANAQFDKVTGDGTVAPWGQLSDIHLLRVRLDGGS